MSSTCKQYGVLDILQHNKIPFLHGPLIALIWDVSVTSFCLNGSHGGYILGYQMIRTVSSIRFAEESLKLSVPNPLIMSRFLEM